MRTMKLGGHPLFVNNGVPSNFIVRLKLLLPMPHKLEFFRVGAIFSVPMDLTCARLTV